MMFKKTLLALIAATSIGLTGCATIKEKPRNITEFIPENYIESRVVDVNKDDRLDIVYLTESKKGYELKVIEANNDGSFTSPRTVKNYGKMDPRTLNYLIFFYYDISKVINGTVK